MKSIIYGVLLCCFANNTRAQSAVQVTHLATLGKVWGFLKYFHPSAIKANVDWDQELLRLIPLVQNANTTKAFNAVLDTWCRSLPAPRLSSTPVNWKADSVMRTFTEEDLQQFGVSAWLKNELIRLYQYHLPDTNRYASRTYDGYYYDHIIHDEKAYDNPLCPSKPVCLLTLFRYWNTITYFYPHKVRLPEWDAVLTKYIKRFLAVENAAQYRYVVRELIHELRDSHSFYQQRDGYYSPFSIDHIEKKYIIVECNDSIAKKYDYQVGDEIVAVNGRPCRKREKELFATTTGTNILSMHRNIAYELLRTGDSVVQVSFKRGNNVFVKSVSMLSFNTYIRVANSFTKPLWQELDKGIWYVRFCRITDADTLRRLFSDIREARAVIWEMRAYPNYKVTTELYKYFFPSKTLFAELYNAWDYQPGAFVKTPHFFIPEKNEELIYNGPLIVLIDEHTQSLAESVASALKVRPNTITIGRQTAGTTGNIAWLSLPGGIEVSYTGVGVAGAHESFRQGEGVKLDIPVAPDHRSIIQGRDPILEQAILHARQYR
jgi:hypothetical protein